MTTATKDEQTLKIANGYNVGDLNLGYTLKTRESAKAMVNAESLPNNVLPGRLVNRNHPDLNYSFVWCPLDDSPYSRKYVADCKAEGYETVSESDWIVDVNSWDWHKPEKWRYRWAVTKLLLNPYDEFLMYRDEIRWQQQQDKRAGYSNEQIRMRSEAALDGAARTVQDKGIAGVEVEGAGHTLRPSTRTIVS